MALIELKTVEKSYEVEERRVHALQGVDLSVGSGEFLAILGRSGCGKSTLLNLLGGMDRPTNGEVWVDKKNVASLDEKGLTQYRRHTVGIVFQFSI